MTPSPAFDFDFAAHLAAQPPATAHARTPALHVETERLVMRPGGHRRHAHAPGDSRR